MKISLNWLNEFVDLRDFNEKPEELADLLTAAGLEVEATENLKKQFENIVIGQILRKGQHPDADRLSVCEVTTGEAVIHQIVCGAKNHQEDDYVVAALPGAVLPGDFKIKISSLRGVESQGMLCSAKELGVEGDSEGIMILDPQTAKVGQSVAEYLGLDDVLFELKVTPNRADCLSHFGLARELASLLGRELIKPTAELDTQGSTKSLIDVKLIDAELCPRYSGRAIRGVRVGASPTWLKSRLEKLGVNSINNVVDVTNYVMLELGQPLHAFDVKKIAGQQIKIDRSVPTETFQSLDGTEYKLTGEELMIRDGQRAVALAGVVGGLNSGVEENTTDLFIESAYFVPQIVRRSSRAFGIDTDSAYRFSRGVDPTGVAYARDRACRLIIEVAGGQAAGDAIDLYPQPVQSSPISLSAQKVSESLGYPVELEELKAVLTGLGCEVGEVGTASIQVLPPAFRVDLEQDMDLVEEFARVNGYDKIPESLPATSMPPRDHDTSFRLQQKLGDELMASGFSEAQNFAFTLSRYQTELMGALAKLKSFGLGENFESTVYLQNPLNEELDVMRSWLSPSLLRNAISNQRKGNEEGQLFEIAPAFGVDSKKFYVQEFRLALVAWGEGKDLWQKSFVPRVFKVKSAIESLLASLHIASYRWEAVTEAEESLPLFHPGQCAKLVVEGKKVGILGSLHPKFKEEYKLRGGDVALVELNLESLLKGQPRSYRVKPLSKFPAVERDLSLTMPKTLASGEIVAAIEKLAGPDLKKVRVFDVYSGDKLPDDQKSVSFRMKLQSPDSTLSDTELSALQEKLIKGLEKAFPVSIR